MLPPTILTEAVAQVGAILILAKPENRQRLLFFAGIERVRYRRPVHPGDVVEIEADRAPAAQPHGTAEGRRARRRPARRRRHDDLRARSRRDADTGSTIARHLCCTEPATPHRAQGGTPCWKRCAVQRCSAWSAAPLVTYLRSAGHRDRLSGRLVSGRRVVQQDVGIASSVVDARCPRASAPPQDSCVNGWTRGQESRSRRSAERTVAIGDAQRRLRANRLADRSVDDVADCGVRSSPSPLASAIAPSIAGRLDRPPATSSRRVSRAPDDHPTTPARSPQADGRDPPHGSAASSRYRPRPTGDAIVLARHQPLDADHPERSRRRGPRQPLGTDCSPRRRRHCRIQ